MTVNKEFVILNENVFNMTVVIHLIEFFEFLFCYLIKDSQCLLIL